VRAPPPRRSWLYAPASRPELLAKAVESEADAVVADLEDAVPAGRKAEARRAVAGFLREPPATPVVVRINHPASGLAQKDVAAVAGPHLAGVWVPKVEEPDELHAVGGWLTAAGCEATVGCLLESALGIERAYDIAAGFPALASVTIGEADLRADLGISDDGVLAWARSRVVIACRAAGIGPPIQSVHTDVRDLDGLRESCRAGRALGFFGRSAIHPSHLAIINQAYTPDEAEVAAARELVDALDVAEERGSGALMLPDGRFVDRAVVQAARRTLALATHLTGGRT
jgi:citrate lyase subunit beta/citryl-CoA lyase